MSSRRRPIPKAQVDENIARASYSNTTDTNGALQVSPSVRIPNNPTSPRFNIEDYLGNGKYRYIKAPAIHPALTDFGPETLQTYLQDELQKLQELADTVQNRQRQELRNFARSLVNSPGDVCRTMEHHTRVFPNLYQKQFTEALLADDMSKGKAAIRNGKRPVRRMPQFDRPPLDDAENPRHLKRIPAADTRSLSDVTNGVDRSDLTYSLGKYKDDDDVLRPLKVVHNSGQNIPQRKGEAPPLQQLSINRSPKATRGYPYAQRLKTKGEDLLHVLDQQPEPSLSGSSSDEDLIEIDIADFPESEGFSDISQQSLTQSRLSRVSSFETHATSTRDTQRTNDQIFDHRHKILEEAERRRKTPAAPLPNVTPVLDSRNTGRTGLDHAQQGRTATKIGNNLNVADPPESSAKVKAIDIPGGELSANMEPSEATDVVMTDALIDVDFTEQKAILASIEQMEKLKGCSTADEPHFDYSRIVPEDMPFNLTQADTNRRALWKAHGMDEHGNLLSKKSTPRMQGQFTVDQLDPNQLNFLSAPDEYGDYPRIYRPHKKSENVFGQRQTKAVTFRTSLPIEIWEADTGKMPGGVLQYLSSTEIRKLRLVCKSLAEDLEQYVFRNVVTEFGPKLFNLTPSYTKEGRLEIDNANSFLYKHGADMNKFGICFDYDIQGLRKAPYKITETTVDAWFGRYRWPIKDYPYFPRLKEIDKLLDDDRRLLTQALSELGQCRELALSVDSGHGWLEGPDMSDLALYRYKSRGGSRVFGKTYAAPDRSHLNGMKELLKWGQLNTINEIIKSLNPNSKEAQEELAKLRAIVIRDYESFRNAKGQPDYNKDLHTGGLPVQHLPGQLQNPIAQNTHPLIGAQQNLQGHGVYGPPATVAPPALSTLMMRSRHQRFQAVMNLVKSHSAPDESSKKDQPKKEEPILPQWPIIFNGYNLAAESRGESTCVQSRVAAPTEFPLLPNCLKEPQAQWLMETSWIQRSFLCAYTDAVRVNANILRNVHSLHLPKISSGLLTCLSQKTFWSCLQSLRSITILVKPDWRFEHTPGDKYFQSNMTIDNVNASYKFTELLKDCIVPLENLNSLRIGYLGSGEQQPGIFGRNQHVLPAPITQCPKEWLIAQNPSNPRPSADTIITFPHVRTLTFENCWFSPLMLEHFMIKSRDTSLHNLKLDSVSLTSQITSTRTDGPLRTVENGLHCHHSPSAWLNEVVPANAAWLNVLDKITPGRTLLDQKYDANMIDEEDAPRPESTFRGNIQQISLQSCGYVKILGIGSNEFNQNELVFQNANWNAMDDGLKARASSFMKTIYQDTWQAGDGLDQNLDANHSGGRRRASSNNDGVRVLPLSRPRRQQQDRDKKLRTTSRFIMLTGRAGHVKSETISTSDEIVNSARLTGYLTQCIHPVEKRLLERMWGMKFGWGDDMSRWEAVEDGWFMGGTGRFSGNIYKDNDLQDAVAIPIEDEEIQPVGNSHMDHTGDDEDSANDSGEEPDEGEDIDGSSPTTTLMPGGYPMSATLSLSNETTIPNSQNTLVPNDSTISEGHDLGEEVFDDVDYPMIAPGLTNVIEEDDQESGPSRERPFVRPLYRRR